MNQDPLDTLARRFIDRVGLQPGQYQIRPEHDSYRAFYYPEPNPRRHRFASIGLRDDGRITVYSNRFSPGDDPRGRFLLQPSRPSVAHYVPPFPRDDVAALDYCALIVRRAYDRGV